MKLKYDQEADAIYVYFSRKPYAYGKELDDERHIDYALDDTLIGIEFLCVSKGVNLSGLPRAKEIAQLLENKGIKIYSVESYAEIKQGYSSVTFNIDFNSSAIVSPRKHSIKLHEEVTV